MTFCKMIRANLAALALAAALLTPQLLLGEEPAAAVDFAKDIRPIFQARCLSCHAGQQAESGLRLDVRDEAKKGGVRGVSWQAGKSAESLVIHLITGENDEKLIMPPKGDRLSAAEIEKIKAWIDQGADWPDSLQNLVSGNLQDHWSFRPIASPAIPATTKAGWIRNPIDAFVLARLESEGLSPSPEADRTTLIRRLYLDLLGLPPTPEQTQEFLLDNRPDAYAQLVDRVLASPHYGERWGRHWLDTARYADSDGYEKDTGRPHAWRYRHWVIEALNQDMPFDRFTILQLAGDLTENPDKNALVATGYHRNTLTNTEGGVDQEEFRVAATIDRVNTTGTVWLGLTIGCAQCHEHKYDPISQRDYYGLFAYFNNIQEVLVGAPRPEELQQFTQAKSTYDGEHSVLVQNLTSYEKDKLPAAQAAWEASGASRENSAWQVVTPSSAVATKELTKLAVQGDGSLLVSGDNPETDTFTLEFSSPLRNITGIKIEALTDPSLPSSGPGRTPHGNFVLSEIRLSATSGAQPGTATAVVLHEGRSDFSQDGFPPDKALDGDPKTGWAVAPEFGKNHTLEYEFRQAVDHEGGTKFTLVLDQQHGTQHTLGHFRISLTASPRPLQSEGLPSPIAAILAVSKESRTAEQSAQLSQYFARLDAQYTALERTVKEHEAKAPVDPATITKAQAVSEMNPPRETHILVRGDFLRPGTKVDPCTLGVLPAIAPPVASPNRLDLARWLVDRSNPLTSRVMVNRVWEKYFGRGIVPTVEDFGKKGELPSHPELLDWLALEFQNQGWSMKALHRLIVTSATYRQSSAQRADLAERDPLNRLLGKQRRLRVEAEIVRDLALSTSGLLTTTIGGPSVRPPQPAGISDLTYANSANWQESQGADRYRRGMYTWFQRTSPYPMLITFDAPESNVTCVRRERSNTPLQALMLLNDPVFFESAQALARRVVKDAPAVTGESAEVPRINRAFQLCLSREPGGSELQTLRDLYKNARDEFLRDATLLDPALGTSPVPAEISREDLAALTMVARAVLNLDEFVTRE